MKRKIVVDDLRPGMFIHDLNCGWMNHPFPRNRFLLRNDTQIYQIAELGIREVFIDTAKGADSPDSTSGVQSIPNDVVSEHTDLEPDSGNQISLSEELSQARRVKRDADAIVRALVEDIRLGRQLEFNRVEPVVETMVDSIFRNRDALTGLCRIRKADEYTFNHSVSVAVLMIGFCRALDVGKECTRRVAVGGLLHDAGKIRVASEILNKPGKLTEQEFAIMKNHVLWGVESLSDGQDVQEDTMHVVSQHHERFDGSGYPGGLKGDQISRYGQMAAIVDVYDALTSDRVYRRGLPPPLVLRELLESSGSHFNEALVHGFIRSVGIYPVGSIVRLESGLVGVVVAQNPGNLMLPVVRVILDTRQQRYETPRDVDLCRPVRGRGPDSIAAVEPPGRWDIEPGAYMGAA